MGKKIRVAILFGGKSAEHEVSLQSAKNIYEAIDRDKYEPLLIGIDKTGRWFLNEDTGFLLEEDDPKLIKLTPSSDAVALLPQSGGTVSNLSTFQNNNVIDVVFPVLHGPFGEDGTVQGLLKLADIPFVGAGVLASSVGMDKDIMKRLFRDAGIPIGKFLSFRSHEKIPAFEEISAELGSPVFIKPANMGSSVGVSKVHNGAEFVSAIKNAFEYDTKIIVEEFISGRELECSVLGGDEAEASIVGEVKSSHDFYSYDAKYIDEKGAEIIIPAPVSKEISIRVRELSVKVFKTLCCEGLGRVDFFLKDNGDVIVNEINTMPGFTRISMYPKLWEAAGLSSTRLIDRLINLAIERFNKEKRLKTSV